MSSNTSVAEPDKVSATLNLKCDLRYQVKVKAATRKGFSADSSHVVVPKATGINIQLMYTIEGVSKILVPRDQNYFLRRSRGK